MGTGTFTISHRVVNGWTVVETTGEIDVHTAPKLRAAVAALSDAVAGRPRFVLDLNHVNFMDSMALGAIVAITKRIKGREGELRIVCNVQPLLKIFRITGLHQVYRFDDSVDAATR
ncbi:STAS domain-containing protein [Streptomyces sp. KR80]|uniref:STAS domain-containing protein n=1 Tax=Streptomyces sp. KR80 TaxID=3457426 RepID=UPI003FCF24D4